MDSWKGKAVGVLACSKVSVDGTWLSDALVTSGAVGDTEKTDEMLGWGGACGGGGAAGGGAAGVPGLFCDEGLSGLTKGSPSGLEVFVEVTCGLTQYIQIDRIQ